LLIAANRKKTEHVCKQVAITIKGASDKLHIEEKEIYRQMEKTAKGTLIERPLTAVPLTAMEKSLEKNQWIKDAELYFDREDVLHVFVEEREPIARVIATSGASFYIDSTGHQMPLIDKLTARLPVITGYINAKRPSAKDSMLLGEIKKVAQFVYGNAFWNAQIGQIDITPDRTFEFIPVIGDHIIRIGSADKIEEKMERLMLFYRQVMRKTGFNKYRIVDVQFDGQVIGVNKGIASAVDSIQLKKNIEELLKRSTIQNVSDAMLPDAPSAVDSIQYSMTIQNDSVSVKTNPNPSKKTGFNPVGKRTIKKPKTLRSRTE
jgi:cell division protein FtsQ